MTEDDEVRSLEITKEDIEELEESIEFLEKYEIHVTPGFPFPQIYVTERKPPLVKRIIEKVKKLIGGNDE